ncbi:MAG: hypothetical protein BWX92_01853 [Deltaproteobacteria bacterium ADurb.Bin135]|nr:MAG: hypothetical protein BWX92_01853 [Deltaproteobacteria bacterium ADurb.Bin135]
MPLSWNPNDYSNLIVRRFVQELINMVQEYSSYVYLRKDKKDQTGLMIKDIKSKKALMEYWPGENRLFARPFNYKTLDVSKELIDEYHIAIKSIGPSITESNMSIFLNYIRKIIIELNKLDSDGESSISEKIFSDGDVGDYLPVRSDFENAWRKFSHSLMKESEISIDDVFDIMEKELLESDLKLHKNWRTITVKNVSIWSKTDYE